MEAEEAEEVLVAEKGVEKDQEAAVEDPCLRPPSTAPARLQVSRAGCKRAPAMKAWRPIKCRNGAVGRAVDEIGPGRAKGVGESGVV